MKNLKRYSQLFESTQELTQEQKDWLDKCINGTWRVNPKTGLVDVEGNFYCSWRKLSDFKGVRFGQVIGSFYCDNNELTSLEGAPQSVRWSFDCSHNELESLKGLPAGFKVGGDFNCSFNELKSLEELPDGFKVDGDFYCYNNKLTSLEGAPQRVGEGFYCSKNNLTSLEGIPQRVGNYFNCSHNELKSLKGLPDGFRVGGYFDCSDNPISERAIKGVVKKMGDKKISLEQAVAEYWKWIPQEDRVYLAKHHPSLPEKEKRIYRAMELNMKRR